MGLDICLANAIRRETADGYRARFAAGKHGEGDSLSYAK